MVRLALWAALDGQRRVTGSEVLTSPPCTSACPAAVHLHCLAWPWLWGAVKQWEFAAEKLNQPSWYSCFPPAKVNMGDLLHLKYFDLIVHKSGCVVDHWTRRLSSLERDWNGFNAVISPPVIAGVWGKRVYHPHICNGRVNSGTVKLGDCEEASQNLSCCSQGFIY